MVKFFFDTVKFSSPPSISEYYCDPLRGVGVGGGGVWVMKIKFIIQYIKKRSPEYHI